MTPAKSTSPTSVPSTASRLGRLRAVTGIAMDSPAPVRAWWRQPRIQFSVAALSLTSVAIALWYIGTVVSADLQVSAAETRLAQALRGTFEDSVPTRAQAVPRKTIFLDATEAGTVKALHVRDGDVVRAGQPLIELVNSSLNLQVANRESDLLRQIAEVNRARRDIEREGVESQIRLAEARYRAQTAASELRRTSELRSGGYVSIEALRKVEDELRHQEQRYAAMNTGHEGIEKLSAYQLEQLSIEKKRLDEVLGSTRLLLDALVIRAPADGTLTGLKLELGQTLTSGARIAQIDSDDGIKLSAAVDEFYLHRVAIGQKAITPLATGSDASLRVTTIYPQVVNGQFRVDLEFDDDAAVRGLRRGQSVDIRVMLDEPKQTLFLPTDSYLDAGGTFVYRVDTASGEVARVKVIFGRRNRTQVEVLDGLSHGDYVIVSSYSNFADRERLRLMGLRTDSR